MPEKVLITGGSGLVGSRLTELIVQRGWQVAHLGRRKRAGVIQNFTWDPHTGRIDEGALEGVTVIIHLAGASIAGRRWTSSYKKKILDSRTHSAGLLFNSLRARQHTVRKFISASGVAWYGKGPMDEPYREDAPPDTGYLASVVVRWEQTAQQFESLGIGACMVRTGLVLSVKGGALPRLMLPVRLGVGARLGTGAQVVSWIHINDLCGIYMHLIEHDLRGPFNAVAPYPVDNRELTRVLARRLHRPLWLPAVPAWMIRLVLGEMSQVVLDGAAISPSKIMSTGFRFRFERLERALDDILKLRD